MNLIGDLYPFYKSDCHFHIMLVIYTEDFVIWYCALINVCEGELSMAFLGLFFGHVRGKTANFVIVCLQLLSGVQYVYYMEYMI